MRDELAKASAPDVPDRKALTTRLGAEGLAHVARLNLEAIAPLVDPAAWPELRAIGARRRLIDFALDTTSITPATAVTPLRRELPALVERFFALEAADAARARAALPALLTPPDAPEAQSVHARLLELRSAVADTVAPRPPDLLPSKELRFDAALPGFRFVDPRPFEATVPGVFGFVKPEVTLKLAPGALGSECSACGAGCVHVLAAIDGALAWIRQPLSKTVASVLQELDRPAWERTLGALERAMEEGPVERAGLQITFRLTLEGDFGVGVAVYVAKTGKNGRPGAPARLARRRVLTEHGTKLSPDDARIVSLMPEHEGLASRALLDALVDHPRVVLENDPDRAVRVERALVGIVAEERRGSVWVSAGVEGTALPPKLLERARRMRSDDVLFLWDGQRLTLLDVKPELRALLEVLHREGQLFPPESYGALVQSLSKWAQRLPVAMPRSVMGESVASRPVLVLRVTAERGGSVVVEIRARPLDDGPTFLPGEGARDVHVRKGEKALHTLRDLRKEEASARALEAALPIESAEKLPLPFQYRFERTEDALSLMAVAERTEPPPDLEWVGTPLVVLPSAGARALKVTVRKKRHWFGVLGGLDVAGERVELARLLDAVRRRDRYIEVSSYSYVEITEALRDHLSALADHAHVSKHGLEIGPSATQVLGALQVAGTEVETDLAFQELAERVESSRDLDPIPPAALVASLRPYQREGHAWLMRLAHWGAGGVLADDMGLGKTLQALAVLVDREAHGPALVVAPTSVAFNWCEEAARFAPTLRFIVYSEATNRDAVLAEIGPSDVLVVSYGLLVRDRERLARRRFATIVFDEAQQLKNAATQRVRAANGLEADFRFALTGTPVENHLGELWSLFAVVFPDLLGSWETFRTRFAAPIEKALDPGAAPALARLLTPFLLRRTKAEVETELPARTEVRVPVVLSAAEWQLYEDARLSALSDLETRKSVLREQQRRVEVLAAITRLRLLASHPRLYDPSSSVMSAKLARLLELVAELGAEHQRALVFSQFTSHLALVREALDARKIPYVYLDGSTPERERGARVREFQEGDAPLFLISTKAGGFGLNLTAATNVIHLDPWWNPAVEDQASDRAHRVGQQRAVTIYRLIALGTIEEQMLALHETKRELVAQIIGGKGGAAKLSTPDLLALLARGRSPTDDSG